jgi:hypothetical protein
MTAKVIRFRSFLLLILISASIMIGPGCTPQQGGSGGLGGLESIVGLGLLAWQLGVFEKSSGDKNHPPNILTLTAVPSQILPGGTTVLTVVAVDADSGDTISYSWTSSTGTLSAPTSAVSSWTAPTGNTGTIYINITVSDGKDSVTGKIPVTVSL